ncbi:MAG: PEPxxWA-CTERM sorting domain-containing protein [Burkholderiales bacterium]|nr:PEPxxWA-CTERM sorting domain-containing protein [Burkholderiales bacterium]MDP2397750.1 PEPxxWA-CTERM sorting domain-containing protein [Burkholderiales bacterium]
MNAGLKGLREVAGLVLLMGTTGAVASTGTIFQSCGNTVSYARYSFDVSPSVIASGQTAILSLGISNAGIGCSGHVSSSQWYSSSSVPTGISGVFSSGDGQETSVTNFSIGPGPLTVSFQYDDLGFYQPSFVGNLLYRHSVTYGPAYPGALPTNYVSEGGGFSFSASEQLEVSAIPEPETYAMLLAGLGLVGGIARRRKA